MYFHTHLKEAFVKTVVQGLPQTNPVRMEAIELLNAHARTLMPKSLRQLIAAYPEIAEWIKVERHYYPDYSGFCFDASLPGSPTMLGRDWLPPEKAEKVDQLMKEYEKRRTNIHSFSKRLMASLRTCRTVSAARKRLPEFADLLPEEEKETPNLPSTNLMGELEKLGWTDPRKAA